MVARYSGSVAKIQTLPKLWLLSDRRNDAKLVEALRRLPRGSGFVFRHYHLAPEARLERFRELKRLAHTQNHIVILSDSAMTAREWGADGIYGAPHSLHRAPGLLRIATAHDLAEIGAANRAAADAVMLSPAFGTRSHPDAPSLGPLKFRLLATRALMPVIALGGMNPGAARRLKWPFWAAIDGLSQNLAPTHPA